MKDTSEDALQALIDDALLLRRVQTYKCFVTNLAAAELFGLGKPGFSAIRARLQRTSFAEGTPAGLSAVLQAFMVLGNRHSPEELSNHLMILPELIVAQILAQGSVALKIRKEGFAPELCRCVIGLKHHNNEK